MERVVLREVRVVKLLLARCSLARFEIQTGSSQSGESEIRKSLFFCICLGFIIISSARERPSDRSEAKEQSSYLP